MPDVERDRATRTVQRILEAAARLAGARGLEAATWAEVASAAEVSVGLLRYHFRSREHLLIEAQRATFRAIHARFEQRFAEGDTGVATAMEVLDALWSVVRDLRDQAPFVVATMARAAHDPDLAARLDSFNAEAVARVELGLLRVFEGRIEGLALPPDRLAHAVRCGLYGLVVELATARTDDDVAQVDQLYADVRGLLAHVLVAPTTEPAPVH